MVSSAPGLTGSGELRTLRQGFQEYRDPFPLDRTRLRWPTMADRGGVMSGGVPAGAA